MRHVLSRLLLSAALAASLCSTAPAADAPDPRVAAAAKLGKDVKPDDLKPTPAPGIYEYMRGTDAMYVTSDGRYAVVGDLYDTATDSDLTDLHRREARLKLLAGIPESQMVVFGQADPKHTITVFTDMDCQYCRKLHSQIATINKLGIRVRYVAFPRTGPNTESWTKAEQVWCSADRQSALTHAKLGQALAGKVCKDNPVQLEYDTGLKFNIEGTPTIVLSNGDVIPGYEDPAELWKAVKKAAG